MPLAAAAVFDTPSRKRYARRHVWEPGSYHIMLA